MVLQRPHAQVFYRKVNMENTFRHAKTYRYETLNSENNPTSVIYALHGYGQLAKYFIQKLKFINKNILVVAPEGMHRFYLKGASGRVGASWMTKEAREIDISDNIDWLNALDKEISTSYGIKHRYLLGFSQGGATAVRWKMNAVNPFHRMIIWASDFPPDMEPKISQLEGESTNHFVIGSEDEFYSEEDQNRIISFYKSVDFKISTYLGPHDIDTTILNAIINQ